MYRLHSPSMLVAQVISYRDFGGGFTTDRREADCTTDGRDLTPARFSWSAPPPSQPRASRSVGRAAHPSPEPSAQMPTRSGWPGRQTFLGHPDPELV